MLGEGGGGGGDHHLCCEYVVCTSSVVHTLQEHTTWITCISMQTYSQNRRLLSCRSVSLPVLTVGGGGEGEESEDLLCRIMRRRDSL